MAPDFDFDIGAGPADLFHRERVEIAQRTAENGFSERLDIPLHPRLVAGRPGCPVLVEVPFHLWIARREFDVVVALDLRSGNGVKTLARRHRYEASRGRHALTPSATA